MSCQDYNFLKRTIGFSLPEGLELFVRSGGREHTKRLRQRSTGWRSMLAELHV